MKNGNRAIIALWLVMGILSMMGAASSHRASVQADEGIKQLILTKQKAYDYFIREANKCADEEEYSPSENLNDLGSECYDDNMSRAYAVQREIAELENGLNREKCPERCLKQKYQRHCPSYCF